MFLGELAYAAENQMRLHWRAAGRIDRDGDGWVVGQRESALQGSRCGGK
jgi:hypothetical protein